MFIHVVANGRVSVPFWDWTTFHCIYTPHPWGFLCGLCVSGKEFPCQCRRCRRWRLDPWIGKIPWSSKWQATPVFLLRKFHGKRSRLGCSPWGHKESDMTECLRTRARLHAFIHLWHLSCFCTMAVVSRTAVNMGVGMSLRQWFCFL